MTQLDVGDIVAAHHLTTIASEPVSVPSADRLVHLQFRRFAGCPICHLHLRSVVGRHGEIIAAGVREVVVFHSSTEALLRYQHELPFAVIADPDRLLYTEFGVESAATAIAHPRTWLAAARGAVSQRSIGAALGRGEDHLGKPADFLIAPGGRLIARKYGAHADDQWSVDQILEQAREFRLA
ncbi:peroxiredoxin-like family protein [Nocardia mangyaensis]|uniref:peroxiredoxin-like family protein n=1 Tax=Nocardia mangyaensis TaxID=2213200 RepID=UPI0026775187|nr:peroxiredoxin-like family protein [Nocardia mangyaensis]MDO3649459.1 peroxiredoxin-like family protein [Nocardia mangyaensis]